MTGIVASCLSGLRKRVGAPGLFGIFCLLVLGLLLSESGAYGTSDIPWFHRSVFWIVMCSLVAGQLVFAERMLRRALPSAAAMARAVRWSGAFFLTWMLTTVEIELLKYTPVLPRNPDPILAFAVFLLPKVAFLAAITVGFCEAVDHLGYDRQAATQASTDPVVEVAATSPSSNGESSQILRVSAEDHYLKIETAEGVQLVRETIRNKVSSLPGDAGLQIHRSHWVARSHVAHVSRSGRDHFVQTKSGDVLPVARGRLPYLREAGWI
ncbi:LytTR family DNA-binding domain-containing protein [Qipengyuania sp.]|uniref:LytTR family DNA-binding domain-containing protein n=1 Tax=Qipengyuania sp. TaxID=2004515 RepID=UPI003BA8F62B